jgi:hypothetical protein
MCKLGLLTQSSELRIVREEVRGIVAVMEEM